MIFADLLPGESVFLDANTLIYHFGAHTTFGAASSQLLQRVENQEFLGFTSTQVLGEAAHRLMTTEASSLFGWPFAGIGNRLRTHPTEVQQLSTFRTALEEMAKSKLRVLTVTLAMLLSAASICQQVGLLTNDGLVVAVMQANGLTKIASNDADFDRVPGLTRYAPV
jgi:predicted nucleic acid-binding protein